MTYPSNLLNQPYSIALFPEEADLIHRSDSMHLFAEMAVSINPVSGLQEALVVLSSDGHSVISEMEALVHKLRREKADKDTIDAALQLWRRIETELYEQRILRLATVQLKDLRAACRWYVLTPLLQLDGKTARDLVNDERGGEVEQYLGSQGIEPQN